MLSIKDAKFLENAKPLTEAQRDEVRLRAMAGDPISTETVLSLLDSYDCLAIEADGLLAGWTKADQRNGEIIASMQHAAAPAVARNGRSRMRVA